MVDLHLNLSVVPTGQHEYELQFTYPFNTQGIIHKLATALFVNGFNIIYAQGEILENGNVKDSIRIVSYDDQKEISDQRRLTQRR